MRVRHQHGCLATGLCPVLWLLGVLCGLLSLTACGAPGSPQPPSLELPRMVQDLTATRKGDKVYLSWSAPTQTTDGQNVRAKKLGPAQMCRADGQFPMPSCAQVIGEIPPAKIPVNKPGDKPQKMEFTDTLPPQLEQQHPTDLATYAVAMLNWRNRSAGLSNQVRVPLAPVLPPPAQVQPEVMAEGIVLSFACPGITPESSPLVQEYRVYRRVEGGGTAAAPIATAGAPIEQGDKCVVRDTTFEWEKTYYYHVTPVTVVSQNGQKIAEVEGEDSPEVRVIAHDIFPPSQPTGLQAVFSGVGQKPFIDLTWAPNTDADLAGYNIYRHEQGQAPVKINPELVATPSFRDQNVEPGKTYFYSVSAVDPRGNESGRSEETSEKVP
jgi:hypothetical protein